MKDPRLRKSGTRRVAYSLAAAALALALAGRADAAPAESPATAPVAPVLRDERSISIDGHSERWRLEWKRPPVPACAPPDPEWSMCPCAGFAFGERGDLDLVRIRDGKELERLALTPLFATDEMPTSEPGAVLRRVEPTEKDLAGDLEDPNLAARVAKRPSESLLDFADYDGDGSASEFLLQIGAEPCGKRMNIALGVSAKEPRLHVLHSTAHPERPLVLLFDHWQALRTAKAPVRRIAWKCGDHASLAEIELELSRGPRGISVHQREYECTEDGERGKLVSESDL